MQHYVCLDLEIDISCRGGYNTASIKDMSLFFKILPIPSFETDKLCEVNWTVLKLACNYVAGINMAWEEGENLWAVNWDRLREMEYRIWWQDKTGRQKRKIKRMVVVLGDGGGAGGWWRRRCKMKWKWVCLWRFKILEWKVPPSVIVGRFCLSDFYDWP